MIMDPQEVTEACIGGSCVPFTGLPQCQRLARLQYQYNVQTTKLTLVRCIELAWISPATRALIYVSV